MSTINSVTLLFGVALLAAACSTAEADLARSQKVCTDVGFPQATDQWRDCVLDLEVAWRHGRYRTVSSREDQRRFCADLGFTPDSSELRLCMAELQAAPAHGRAPGLLYDDGTRCRELGLAADTDDFRRCLVIFEVARRHRASVGTRRW